MISIIGFPNYLGQKLLSNSNTPLQVVKYLGIPTSSFFDLSTQLTSNLFTNLKILFQTNQKIKTPKVNIGGDHSMAIASVADSLQKYPNVKVIWVDAHPDINTYNGSLTKNYHGMPLSFLTGIDKNKKFNFINKLLNFENLLYIGIRDIDKFEKQVIKNNNINVISVDNVNNDVYNSIDKINNFIGNDPVHLSFDVDCLDPLILQSTGTKVNDGLYLEETIEIIKVINQKNLINTDITELNLDIGSIDDKLNSLSVFCDIMKIFN